jgi:putative addiction module component (TIGR02574 family)
MTDELQNIDSIPISTRLLMVEDIWDSIARSNADVPVYDWQKLELARRKENFKANPDVARSWQHVQDSILRSHA